MKAIPHLELGTSPLDIVARCAVNSCTRTCYPGTIFLANKNVAPITEVINYTHGKKKINKVNLMFCS